MSASLYSLSHFVHYLGFALALGGSFAALRCFKAARERSAQERAGFEAAGAEIITKIELPGLFIALAGGLLAVYLNPAVLNPKESGAGPWLHIKLTLVLGLLIISHLRMFRSRGIVRERAAGATEGQIEALSRGLSQLGTAEWILFIAIFFVATFRTILFN